MKEGINVLSLFDGMGCARLALDRVGIKVNKYFASEVDAYAIKVTGINFPDIVHLGDVMKVKGSDLPKIDLVVGGSPCQGFSFAGKGLNFEDERSKLFFEFVRLVGECKPRWFMLENVRMKKEHEEVISRYMGVNPIMINSSLVSAQNRVRLWWTNIGMEEMGLFGDKGSVIEQPKDREILLRDILEKEVDKKYFLSDKMLNYFSTRADNFNSGRVNIRDEEGESTALLASMASCDISDNFIKVDTDLTISNNQEKANCFTAGGNSGGLHSDMTLIAASRGRNPKNPKSRESGLNTEQHLEPRFDGKTNCITSVQKDNLVFIQRGHGFNTGFEKEVDKSPSLTSHSFEHNNFIKQSLENDKATTIDAHYFKGYGERGGKCRQVVESNFKISRLTPIECCRLQTVPDDYFFKNGKQIVSDTQMYKMLGNGWTVDVAAHIFGYLKKEIDENQKSPDLLGEGI